MLSVADFGIGGTAYTSEREGRVCSRGKERSMFYRVVVSTRGQRYEGEAHGNKSLPFKKIRPTVMA